MSVLNLYLAAEAEQLKFYVNTRFCTKYFSSSKQLWTWCRCCL